jgi:hypothetical protein
VTDDTRETDMRTTRWMTALMAVGLLATTACGGDDGAADDPEATATVPVDETTTTTAGEGDDGVSDVVDEAFLDDACPLLGGIDLAALLGEPAGEPEASSQVCRVRPASADSRGNLQLVVATSRAADNYETQQETFGVDTEVDGLGDAAFHSGPYLFVLDGDVLAFMQVIRDSTLGIAVDDSDLEAAMSTVLANIAAS